MDIDSETTSIKGFIDRGNYQAGINRAISAMNACRRDGDQPGVDHFLDMIKAITDTMTEEFGNS